MMISVVVRYDVILLHKIVPVIGQIVKVTRDTTSYLK